MVSYGFSEDVSLGLCGFSLLHAARLQFSDLAYKQPCRDYGSSRIGDGHGVPYPLKWVAEDVWEEEEAGQEEDELAGEAEEDALCGISDALEECSADDLHADEREEEYADAQSVSGGLHHFFRVCSEEAYERLSEEGAKHESGGADDGRGYHGIVQYLYETVVALCPIVVAGDGLEGLVDANDNEDDEH